MVLNRLGGFKKEVCDMSYTQKLADYLENLRYKDIPKEVIEQAKLLTLHTVGVALASYPTGQAKRAIALAKSWGSGQKESTLLGDGTKVSSVNAAFANGTMADLLDWEDCSWTGHPSANAIPGALALAEAIKAPGKEYILALVGGWEVYQRIAMAVQPSDDWGFLKKGWGLTSWEIYAAAMPAAKLLKLRKEKINQVIGIAGAMTPIVNAKVHRTLSDFYHYQHGFTCRDGVASALVAQSGIETLHDFLDGEDGYWCTISDQCDWDWYTKKLSKDFTIMETLFKHWPTNMWIQTPLDTLDALVKRDSIKVGEIAEILISPQFEYRMGYKPEGYKSITEAEFSIPYCLAVYLLDPEPGPNWYDKKRFKDPKVLELAKKVKGTGPTQGLQASFKLMREGSFPEVTIKVTLKDGKEFTNTIRFPKGHPKNRLTYDEFKDRFRRAASFALKPKKIEEAMEKILNLEKMDDLSTIGQVLHG
jgi:2-methylcitrate dehydratase PrpD